MPGSPSADAMIGEDRVGDPGVLTVKPDDAQVSSSRVGGNALFLVRWLPSALVCCHREVAQGLVCLPDHVVSDML